MLTNVYGWFSTVSAKNLSAKLFCPGRPRPDCEFAPICLDKPKPLRESFDSK